MNRETHSQLATAKSGEKAFMRELIKVKAETKGLKGGNLNMLRER
jgi:hypothetical protein